MLIFEPHTWAALAGAAYLASSPAPEAPGLYVEQFTPGRGLAVYAVDQADPVLARSGLTRRLRRQEEPPQAKRSRLMAYEFGRRAIPLHRSGRTQPGLMLAGGVEKRILSPRGCGGLDARCDSYAQTRRINLGFGYGDETNLVSLTYFNDRIRQFGVKTRFANGAQAILVRKYDHLF